MRGDACHWDETMSHTWSSKFVPQERNESMAAGNCSRPRRMNRRGQSALLWCVSFVLRFTPCVRVPRGLRQLSRFSFRGLAAGIGGLYRAPRKSNTSLECVGTEMVHALAFSHLSQWASPGAHRVRDSECRFSAASDHSNRVRHESSA